MGDERLRSLDSGYPGHHRIDIPALASATDQPLMPIEDPVERPPRRQIVLSRHTRKPAKATFSVYNGPSAG